MCEGNNRHFHTAVKKPEVMERFRSTEEQIFIPSTKCKERRITEQCEQIDRMIHDK